MRVLIIVIMLIFHLVGYGQFKNVKLPIPKKATYYYSQVEPSIYINPNNTNQYKVDDSWKDFVTEKIHCE